MKRPTPIIPRPASSITRRPRTRTEAAIELVRAEFERERLERDMTLLRRRYQVSAIARTAAVGKGRRLLARLAQDSAPAPLPREARP